MFGHGRCFDGLGRKRVGFGFVSRLCFKCPKSLDSLFPLSMYCSVCMPLVSSTYQINPIVSQLYLTNCHCVPCHSAIPLMIR